MRRVSLALLLAGSAGIPALAQDLYGGIGTRGTELQPDSGLTATISQSLEADSNYDLDDESPGTSYFADTRLQLGIVRSFDDRSIGFGLDTGLRALDQADEDFEFTLASPTSARFDYDQETANTTFDTTLRYRQRRTDFRDDDLLLDQEGEEGETPIIDDLTDQDLQNDTRQHRFDGNIGFEYGTSDPSTYGVRAIATAIDYDDDDTSLVPRRSAQGEVYWALRINPVFSTLVRASYFHYEADNQTETELDVAEFDAGVIYNPDETLRVRGGIGYADRTEEELRGGVRQTTEDEQGIVLRGDFRYILPDFTVLGDGRFTTAAPDPRFSFNLRGNYLLPRGRITGRVYNRFTGSSNTGDEARVTGAGIGFVHDINQVSSFGLDFAVAYQENLDDPDAEDISRGFFTASYTHELTDTVSAEIGYGYRKRIEDPDDADSHRVFVVLGKSFSTGL